MTTTKERRATKSAAAAKAEERRLARQVRRGDDAARWALVMRVYPALVKLAHKNAASRNLMTRLSRVDPDDLANEYALHLHRKIHKFDPAKGRLTTYAYRLVHHLHLNHVRTEEGYEIRRVSREKSGHVPDRDGATPFQKIAAGEDPAEAAAKAEERRRVRRAVAMLDPDQQEAVRQRFWEGKVYGEMDRRVTREAVRLRVDKALAEVAVWLA